MWAYLVKSPPNINWCTLNNPIDNDGQGRQEVTRVYLGVKKDLRRQKPLIPHIYRDLPPSPLVDNVLREALGVFIEAREFLDYVWADVTEFLLNALCGFKGAVGFVSVAEERLDEVSDVAASDGD